MNARGTTADTAHELAHYRGPTGPLRRRCSQCLATGARLLRCSACHVVYYCSQEHQVAHRVQHKLVCTRIRKARVNLAKEEHSVRNATPDIMTPANAFETNVGRFWGTINTRDYMNIRFVLAGNYLIQTGTFDGVQESLEHLRDMLRLCRADNLGVRDLAPAVMLRLDLDQECYDFVKWWMTCDPDGHYDWADTTLPYLDIHSADVLESPNFLLESTPSVHHLIAMLILKLKLLIDIRNLKVTRQIIQPRLPPELWSRIEQAVIRSPLSTRFQAQSPAHLLLTEQLLKVQTLQIGAATVEANEYLIFHLFEPDEALKASPEYVSSGSWEEMAIALQNSYAAWWETDGVLSLLEDARACAARESNEEIAEMMQSETFKKGSGSRRTAEELLADVSLNRIWGYLDDAIENASFLGPLSERPSERRMQALRRTLADTSDEDAEFESSLSGDSDE